MRSELLEELTSRSPSVYAVVLTGLAYAAESSPCRPWVLFPYFTGTGKCLCFNAREDAQQYCDAVNAESGWSSVCLDTDADWAFDVDPYRATAFEAGLPFCPLKWIKPGTDPGCLVSDFHAPRLGTFEAPPYVTLHGPVIAQRRPRVAAGTAERKPGSLLYTPVWGTRARWLLEQKGPGGVVIRGAAPADTLGRSYHGPRVYRTREEAQGFSDLYQKVHPERTPPWRVFGVEADWEADAYDGRVADVNSLLNAGDYRFLRHDACLVPV